MYRALRADNHRLAIFGEGYVEEDNFAFGLGGSFFQVIKSTDHQYLCRDALLWCADAAAQAKHRQLAMTWSDHLGRFLAANPAGHPDRLAPDIFETVLFHLGKTPVDGVLEILGTGEARPKRVAHRGQARETKHTVGRCVSQSLGFRLIIRRGIPRSRRASWNNS